MTEMQKAIFYPLAAVGATWVLNNLGIIYRIQMLFAVH